MTEVWKDHIGLAHAAVPLTFDAENDREVAREAVREAYGPDAADRLKFERVSLHGMAYYSEQMGA